jgi:pyruvate/2-oxoglutarate dehydrogenase complex dihydrolipoamide dehydrogenase (E3) component
MSIPYDAIIIGTGQAGPPLAGRLTQAGMKVAIIERKLFGGTCINTGCIPTKALIASAHAAHLARRAADFGVEVAGPVRVDMKKVKARKDAISSQSREGVERRLREMTGCTVYQGQAQFESAREVRVGSDLLRAEQIFINVGGSAAIPKIPGLDQIDFLTNASMMGIDDLPRHLLIMGGGYVALEFGQMYRRFGSEVTILERGERLAGNEDEDVSAALREILEGEGIEVRLQSEGAGVEPKPGGLRLRTRGATGLQAVCGSHLLIAAGRRPNTADLGLDRAGVAQDEHGYIRVDDELRTSAPGIWALGECNGQGAFTHTSYNDFEIVAANLLEHDHRRLSDRIRAYCIYTDPPLGRAGLTEAAVRQSGRPAFVARRPMTRVTRAQLKGETAGFMKFLVDAETERILGTTVLGTGGDEVIHCILDVMYAKAPYTVLRRAMHVHPTVAELVPTTLGELEPLRS